MKGQNRLFMEIMVFAIGIFILGFVTDNFTNVGSFVGESSVDLQATGILNLITSSVAKVSISNNSQIEIDIPSALSGLSYNISLSQTDRYMLKLITKNNQTFVKKIFKQPSNYNIIIEPDIIESSSEGLRIRKEGNQIRIEATDR